MSTIGKTEAWRNGWEACKKGFTLHRNPYDPRTQAYSASQWEKGFLARQHASQVDIDVSDWEATL